MDSMYSLFVNIHSIGRWIVLLLLIAAIFKSATAGNRPYTSGDNKLGLFLTISADLMLLIGIYLWVAGPWGYQLLEQYGMSAVMKNDSYRFFAVEHQIGMLIAIILLHIGKAQGKKNLTDKSKHRRTFVFYLLSSLLILASIPWPFREIGAGRGWV